MKLHKLAVAASITAAAVLAALTAAAASFQRAGTESESARLAASELRLLFAQPFVLDESYRHAWRADAPVVKAGFIVVLAADPEVLPPLQVHHPLLFAGDMPLERVNDGSQTGVYVGFAPAHLGADGEPALDLKTTPFFWAKPDLLPSALSPSAAAAVLKSALAAGAEAEPAAVVDQALAAGGGTVYLAGYGPLRRYAAAVIERYSPQETDLISGLRAPLLLK